MAFLEGTGGDQLIKEDLDSVARYEIYFEQLSDLALPQDQGVDLLRKLIGRLSLTGEAAAVT
jgi:hypothetical protein